mmetsp:Transcript_20188/g.14896  ORF Transcript_20188/g.14896 Transcript_20188/m.14896 type:complete len:191 (+) Transcript_20188:463-1035(+)
MKNTVVEVVFHMIYIDNNESFRQEEEVQVTNKDRYPQRKVCQDQFDFISYLEQQFSQCRTDYIKDNLWEKFFKPKIHVMADSQINDMLKFSAYFDLKKADKRYAQLLALKKFTKEFSESVQKLFGERCKVFKRNQLQGMGHVHFQLKQEDILIFDPDHPHFLLHLEFDFTTKAVQAFLVRKDWVQAFLPN